MDEKDLNTPGQDTTPEKNAPLPKEEDREVKETEKEAGSETQEKEDGHEKTGWQYDAQVETDLSKMELSYSGKEIEIVAPLLKEEPQPNSDVITISKTKMRKTFKIAGIVIGAVLAAAIVALGVVYSFFLPNNMELMTPANTALQFDGTKVSVGAYNYYYNSFTSDTYLSNYASMGLDTTADFSKQIYDESTGETWADYFENNAVEELRWVIYYYNCAKEAGLKLSAEEKEQLDEAMDGLVSNADTSNQSTSAYLKEQFGEHVGLKTIRKMQEVRYLAQKYVQQLSTTEKISGEEVQGYYNEHPEELEVASFRYLPIPYTSDTKEETRAKAEELKGKLTTPETFTETAKPYAEEEYQSIITDSYTLIADITSTNEQIPGDIKEWLFTNGVNVNDVNIFDNEEQSCFYVVMMSEAPHLNEEKLFSVRHLLVKVKNDVDDDGNALEPTEAQWKECQDKAQGYLDEFNKTDKSELSFAKLADEKSEDTASTSKQGSEYFGGLLAQQPEGQLVEEFENWSTAPERQYGDVGMVKTEYGYHLIYFISNQEAWKFTAENALLGQKQDENVEKIKSDKKLGFKNRTIAKPTSGSNGNSTNK